MHATGAKRTKTRASEARLVLAVCFSLVETGVNVVNQSQSVVKLNKTALISIFLPS